jgi:hypothetical protein
MKEKIDKFQHAIVSGFAVVSLISSGIQPTIKLIKSGFSETVKELSLPQVTIANPSAKTKHKKH